MTQTGLAKKKDVSQKISDLKRTLRPENFKNITEYVKQNRKLKKLEQEATWKEDEKKSKIRMIRKLRQENEKKVFGVTKAVDKSNKRAASIQVTEDALMLKISNDFFKNEMIKVIKDDMDTKIRLLSVQPYFAVSLNQKRIKNSSSKTSNSVNFLQKLSF